MPGAAAPAPRGGARAANHLLAHSVAALRGALGRHATRTLALVCVGDSVWPLLLALVPLLQSTGQGTAGVLKVAGGAFALAVIYFGLHAWLVTWASPLAQAPGPIGAVFVATAFAALFGLQCSLTTQPQGALATRLYPAFYGGLFLDERFSRAVFRLWPLRPAETRPSPTSPPLATARS